MLRGAVLVAMLATGCGRLGFGEDGPPIEDGLVGYWKLDDTRFLDSSGYGNPANTCYDGCPTLAPGVRGMAADFHDAEGLEVGTVAPLSGLSQSLTLAAWVNLRSFTDYGVVISTDRDCCETQNGFSLWASLFQLQARMHLWNQSSTAVGPVILPTNTWVFLVGTYDGQTAALYADGVIQTTVTHADAIGLPHSYPLRIGHPGYDFGGGLDGLVDEVMIFDRALSDAEITTIYTALKP